MKTSHLALLLAPMMVSGILLPGCSTAPPTQQARQDLTDEATNTLNDMKGADSSLDSFLTNAYGYVVFPSVGKGGAGIGGAYGRGEVFEQGKRIGFADLSQGSVGLQLGGQTYSEVIAFENKDALERFKSNRMELAANASAVALKSGAATTAKYDNGIAAFVKPKEGLMAEASIGRQQFSYESRQNAASQ